jgi:hypothetical protein
VQARLKTPNFKIFTFSTAGPIERVQNGSAYYFPILYCSPRNDGIVGLDLNDDVEGPAIWRAFSTNSPTTAAPFDGRAISHSTFNGFNKLLSFYMPLYHSNSTLTDQPNDDIAGCLVTVIAFRALFDHLFATVEFKNTDVFLFWIQTQEDGSNISTYMIHFESDPDTSKPNIDASDAAHLQPKDITGDIVSDFGPEYDVVFFDKVFRTLFRARKGSIAKDVLLFNRM